ncbi:hypothetical protein C8R44DRAFT_68855 [Mycena epipterygia]|nr:hypothetical protein C8R44DRAFT_68855 [Mycena epipterygia]
MLIGFVVRDEAEWIDLRRRIGELPRTIFAIQDEPPTWSGADDDDDDMGLKSISDPEEEAGLVDWRHVERVACARVECGARRVVQRGALRFASAGHGASSGAGHMRSPLSETSHAASSIFSHTHVHSNSNSTNSSSARSKEMDTEAVAPITPLPNARFSPGHTQTPSSRTRTSSSTRAGRTLRTTGSTPLRRRPRTRRARAKSGKRSRGAAAGEAGVTAERDGLPAPGQWMHTARAREGGQTHSGGVRGVIPSCFPASLSFLISSFPSHLTSLPLTLHLTSASSVSPSRYISLFLIYLLSFAISSPYFFPWYMPVYDCQCLPPPHAHS